MEGTNTAAWYSDLSQSIGGQPVYEGGYPSEVLAQEGGGKRRVSKSGRGRRRTGLLRGKKGKKGKKGKMKGGGSCGAHVQPGGGTRKKRTMRGGK